MAPSNFTETFAVLLVEGGYWVEWGQYVSGVKYQRQIHAIAFTDGSIWDCVNGWRQTKLDVEFVKNFWKNEQQSANQVQA